MSDELKPCPFCGGEAKAFFCEKSGTYDVQCQQCGALPFLGRKRGPSRFKSMDDVIAAWNRRAERTCRVEVERRKLSQTQTAVVKTCSECGFEFGVEKENAFPFEVTLNVVVPPSYCPNCGARIVEEES